MDMEKIYKAFPKVSSVELDRVVTYLEAGGMFPVKTVKTRGTILCRDEALSIDSDVIQPFSLPDAVRYAMDTAAAFEAHLVRKMNYIRRESREKDELLRELRRVRKDRLALEEMKKNIKKAAKAA